MCPQVKRIGCGQFGPPPSLFLQTFQAFCGSYCIKLIASTLPTTILDAVTFIFFFRYAVQWWLKSLWAAADNVTTWLDLPPPWPDELIYHCYPRHHRKFGVYYKALQHKVASSNYCALLLSAFLFGASYFLTPIVPFHPVFYTAGWESTPTPTITPTMSPISPSLLDAFLADSDPSEVVRLPPL